MMRRVMLKLAFGSCFHVKWTARREPVGLPLSPAGEGETVKTPRQGPTGGRKSSLQFHITSHRRGSRNIAKDPHTGQKSRQPGRPGTGTWRPQTPVVNTYTHRPARVGTLHPSHDPRSHKAQAS